MNDKTEAFLPPLRKLVEKLQLPIAIQSAGSMFTIFFGIEKVQSKEDLHRLDEKTLQRFFKFLFNRGIYISPYAYEAHFLSRAHTQEHLQIAQAAMMEFIHLQA